MLKKKISLSAISLLFIIFTGCEEKSNYATVSSSPDSVDNSSSYHEHSNTFSDTTYDSSSSKSIYPTPDNKSESNNRIDPALNPSGRSKVSGGNVGNTWQGR